MKVKIKSKEQTGFEKRNTAIATFASVAAIPLMLALFIGYMLGNTNTENKENLQDRINTQLSEIDSLNKEIERLNGNFLNAKLIFAKADSLFNKLNVDDLPNLEQKLDAAASDVDFYKWEKENDRLKVDFNDALERIVKPLDFDESTVFPAVLRIAKDWLIKYADSKADELFIKKLNKKQSIGMDTSQDKEDEIKDLKNQLLLKEIELKSIAGSGNQEKGNIKMDLKDTSEDLAACEEARRAEGDRAEKKYNKLVSQNKEIKIAIEIEVKAIQEDIIPELRRELFNDKKFEKAKKKLETKINNVATKAAAITTS